MVLSKARDMHKSRITRIKVSASYSVEALQPQCFVILEPLPDTFAIVAEDRSQRVQFCNRLLAESSC